VAKGEENRDGAKKAANRGKAGWAYDG